MWLQFVEVLGPDGRRKRFAEGTRAGFIVQRFNKLNPSDTHPVVCIQAHKEGEEPIEYGPEVELRILHDKSWTLQTVSECKFSSAFSLGPIYLILLRTGRVVHSSGRWFIIDGS
jgi:hypothetical protein